MPVRLERETPAAGQAGCATAIGAFLALLGTVIVYGMRSDNPRPGDNEWLVYVVGGSFALVGVVVLLLGIKMALATRVPETMVEVIIHQHNVLDVSDVTVLARDELTRQADVTLPVRLELGDVEGHKVVVWRLEVWGKVRGWTDFGHPFVLDVRDVKY